MDNIYCVYFHTNAITDEVFYVGIGNTKRPYNKRGRSAYWRRYSEKYGYNVKIIHENLSWEECCKLEVEYIKKYKKRTDGGTLVNLTDGGEGTLGYTDSSTNKVVYCYDLNGNLVAEFKSVSEASRNIKISKSCVSSAVDRNVVVKYKYLFRSYKSDSITFNKDRIVENLKWQGRKLEININTPKEC